LCGWGGWGGWSFCQIYHQAEPVPFRTDNLSDIDIGTGIPSIPHRSRPGMERYTSSFHSCLLEWDRTDSPWRRSSRQSPPALPYLRRQFLLSRGGRSTIEAMPAYAISSPGWTPILTRPWRRRHTGGRCFPAMLPRRCADGTPKAYPAKKKHTTARSRAAANKVFVLAGPSASAETRPRRRDRSHQVAAM